MKRTALLALAVLALTAGGALAMTSTSFRLSWFEQMTGAGGPHMASTHYEVDVTAGQSAIGPAASTNYRVQMGYWGAFPGGKSYLPLIVRD